VAPANSATELVEQHLHPVDKGRKAELLSHLIRTEGWYQALVFSRTKHGANKLVKQLQMDGINAGAIHGNKSQAQRTKVLEQFKNGDLQIMVATDIAARGIDIDQLPQVVNFDLPNVPEDYVHRIGRTGRAGSEGKAVSLVSADESKQLRDIERLLKRAIPRADVAGFEPREMLGSGRPSPSASRPASPRSASARPASARPAENRSAGRTARQQDVNAPARREERSASRPGSLRDGQRSGQGRSAEASLSQNGGPQRRHNAPRKAAAKTEVLSVW
jgi:ATP-dependent RNA helicase RhlE